MTVQPQPGPAASSQRGAGVLYTITAYLLWGVLPLYFLLVWRATPWEVVAWRIVFSLVFCAFLVLVTRSWRRLLAIARQPKLMGLIALAGVLVYINWQVFVLGTLTGHVVETSLGYFMNPIVTVLLGVLVLRERLRSLQWVAIGLAALAVIVIAIGYGAFPWISVALALSFGCYGLVKNRIGGSVDAVSGLTLETVWLMPVAVVQLAVVALSGALTIGSVGPDHTLLLIGLGVVTAVPLLLFAAGTRRVPLSVVGMLQFAAPILQFLIGVLVQHEPMPPERWIGFAIVWCAVAVFAVDSLRAGRRASR
ncbi:EamA family transporter RarD [Microbacterium gorillae]|uniref:EamA family transporter RarD n=1 Tax=Microbacterium gorillae TaxID=1231063 RepID=UPI00058D9E3C|nr:EamA family transporter RarD [Microbacterium gorillae]